MIWATVSSWSCFCWLYRASPSLAAKNIINLILVLTLWWCPCVESSLVLLEEGVCDDQCVPLVSLIFLKRSLVFPFCFPLFLCTDHGGRLSYLSLLFFGTLHSNRYIFPFLLCFLLLFLSQLFVRPTQTAILLFCIYFSWGWSCSLSPV